MSRDDPAFPLQLTSVYCDDEYRMEFPQKHERAGLTKLEQVSAMMMQGIMAGMDLSTGGYLNEDAIAAKAISCATQLFNQLEELEDQQNDS